MCMSECGVLDQFAGIINAETLLTCGSDWVWRWSRWASEQLQLRLCSGHCTSTLTCHLPRTGRGGWHLEDWDGSFRRTHSHTRVCKCQQLQSVMFLCDLCGAVFFLRWSTLEWKCGRGIMMENSLVVPSDWPRRYDVIVNWRKCAPSKMCSTFHQPEILRMTQYCWGINPNLTKFSLNPTTATA